MWVPTNAYYTFSIKLRSSDGLETPQQPSDMTGHQGRQRMSFTKFALERLAGGEEAAQHLLVDGRTSTAWGRFAHCCALLGYSFKLSFFMILLSLQLAGLEWAPKDPETGVPKLDNWAVLHGKCALRRFEGRP